MIGFFILVGFAMFAILSSISADAVNREAGGPGDGDSRGINWRRDLFSVCEYIVIYSASFFMMMGAAELLKGVRVGVV